jgi:hypothetical protein
MALVQHGHQVYWLLPTDSLPALDAAALAPAVAEAVPATCRYIVPVQPYQCAGVQIIGVDHHVWQHADLHTRLFTFLSLFQRAVACDVWHTWVALAVAYVVVYTARFLAVPAVVSYGWQLESAGSRQPFVWHWVAQQVSAAVVPSLAARQRLLTCSALTPARLHVLDPARSAVGDTLTALYARLCGAVRS